MWRTVLWFSWNTGGEEVMALSWHSCPVSMDSMEPLKIAFLNMGNDRGTVWPWSHLFRSEVIQFVHKVGFLLWLSLIVSIHTLIGRRAVYCVIFQGQIFFSPKCFSPHEVQISSSLDSSTCDDCWRSLDIERPKKKRLLKMLLGWRSKSFSFTFASLLFVDSPSVWLFEKTPFSFTSLWRMTRTCAVGILNQNWKERSS